VHSRIICLGGSLPLGLLRLIINKPRIVIFRWCFFSMFLYIYNLQLSMVCHDSQSSVWYYRGVDGNPHSRTNAPPAMDEKCVRLLFLLVAVGAGGLGALSALLVRNIRSVEAEGLFNFVLERFLCFIQHQREKYHRKSLMILNRPRTYYTVCPWECLPNCVRVGGTMPPSHDTSLHNQF
jgi:hypothetical protein